MRALLVESLEPWPWLGSSLTLPTSLLVFVLSVGLRVHSSGARAETLWGIFPPTKGPCSCSAFSVHRCTGAECSGSCWEPPASLGKCCQNQTQPQLQRPRGLSLPPFCYSWSTGYKSHCTRFFLTLALFLQKLSEWYYLNFLDNEMALDSLINGLKLHCNLFKMNWWFSSLSNLVDFKNS